MESYDNKIFEVYHSKDYSEKIIRWRDFLKVPVYQVVGYSLLNLKNLILL